MILPPLVFLDFFFQSAIFQAEGIRVFELNIEIVRSLRGVDEIFRRKCFTFFAVTGVVVAAIVAYFVYGRSA
jgi:hypothetical protein